MSYAEDVRVELARLPAGARCCRRAELSALARGLGFLRLSGDGPPTLELATGNPALTRRVFRSLRHDYHLHPVITTGRRRTSRARRYLVRAGGSRLEGLLEDIMVWHRLRLYPGIGRRLVHRRCCRRSYLRGFFLGRGSINQPARGHHLELVVPSPRIAQDLAGLMRTFALSPGISSRKDETVLYLKDAQAIAGFLGVVGASQALLQFENSRVYRSVKERVNRLVNMETANVDRTVEAAARQVRAIRLIDEQLGLHQLPRGLREVAESRLRLPELSLEELGQSMSPPLGKSAVNHRLRRLLAMAARLSLDIPSTGTG